MKYLSLFSGIGAFEKALDNLGVDYELAAYCEIDKYASKSYAAIHCVPEIMNLGDITKVDEKELPHDLDLITYGFPCQDISIAGRQKGLIDENGQQTRSGLFFEALRIIEETQPRVAIAENVKNLTGNTFKKQFALVLKSLDDAGYNNYWQVLNLKDYGIPQNRERVFIVSIRKDIDNGLFFFPAGFPLKLRLKDILEAEVDEKYYMSDKAMKGLEEHKRRNAEKGNGFGYQLKSGDDIAPTIRARYYKDGQECLIEVAQSDESTARIITVGTINGSQDGVVVSPEGIAKCHTAGNNNTPKILVNTEPAVKQIGNCCPTRTRDNPNQGRIYDTDGLAPALNCMGGGNRQPCVPNEGRIRKLTPKECFRLMGFSDADHEKASAVNSNTQLYKQAGNSIGVPVVQYIQKALIDCGALTV